MKKTPEEIREIRLAALAKARAVKKEKAVQAEKLANKNLLPLVAVQTEHSFISPSALERVTNCPASVVLTKDLPNVETEFAKEGTLFHEYMEKLLKHPPVSEMSLADFMYNIPDSEMALNVQTAYNYISRMLKALKPCRVDVECKLPAYYSDKDFGTLDLGLLIPKASNHEVLTSSVGHYDVVILDWKYGKGHYVEVERNKQLASYAMSYCNFLKAFFFPFDVDKITTVVYQPRALSSDGKTARAVHYTMEELTSLCNEIEDKVKVAYNLLTADKCTVESNTQAGEHCLFCKLKTTCKKYCEFVHKDAVRLLEDIKSPALSTVASATAVEGVVEEWKPVATLTDEELVRIVEFGETKLPKLKSYIEAVMTLLQNRLEQGETIDGVKLVHGRGRRKWIEDEQKIISILEENGVDCTRTTLKTLTEIESSLKLIDKTDLLDYLVVKDEGKPRIALSSDKRKEISSSLITNL